MRVSLVHLHFYVQGMASRVSSDDLAVQATNNDATSCKRFAVQRGYWKDDFIQHFGRSAERRSPEISRGYFARVKSIHLIVRHFIELTNRKCQVVSYGAGFDTLFWILHAASLEPKTFVEVDFSSVTARKCQYIKTKQCLFHILQDPTIGKDELHSLHYHLIPSDLRNVTTLGDQLLSTGLDTSLPTLFLAECVLVYMEPERSREVIQWTNTNFSTALFINYDPIHPDDRFGIIMQENLKTRGCSLLGIHACPDLNSQARPTISSVHGMSTSELLVKPKSTGKVAISEQAISQIFRWQLERYVCSGWEGAWSLDMATVYSLLPYDEVKRIEQLDFLDERELLTQLLQHYCLSCGYNDQLKLGLQKIQLGKI